MSAVPYLTAADVVDQQGNVIHAAIPVSIWPSTSQRAAPGGEVYDHTGEAPPAYAAVLGETNMSLVQDERRYRVIQAVAHPMGIPHTSLRLRRVRPGG